MGPNEQAPRHERAVEIDNREAREYATTIAKEAGAVLLEYLTKSDLGIHYKGDGGFTDIATEADLATERFLTEKLLSRFPGSVVLGEETAASDYSALKNAEHLWIIDPIDGTANFSRRDPSFAISIALVERGQPVVAVVHMPALNKTYTADAASEGAFLNGTPIKVSDVTELSRTVLEADSGMNDRSMMFNLLSKLSPPIGQVKVRGSSVSALAFCAEGSTDAGMFPSLKPWDVAAAALLIKKAGGTVSRLDGGSWDAFEPSMLAANPTLHRKLLQALELARAL